ncbi:hypothetical protein [Ilumatobacter sp.]|uniref:hypothetical protein n=1 Tax=Ilumatobacter sp. TaxID=1967498 RepID=UPI003B51C4F8
MPVWFDDLSTVVTAAPGTGSTSLVSACSGAPGACDLLDGVELGDDGIDRKHATMAQVSAVAAVAARPRPDVVVTTTRNPFDFYVAEWHRTRTRWAAEVGDEGSWVNTLAGMRERIAIAVELDFDSWLRHELADDLSRPGARRRLNRGHVTEATVVVRMERMDDDLRRLHPELSQRIGPVPHVNRTQRDRPYWRHYSPWGHDAVARLHAEDIARYDYRF